VTTSAKEPYATFSPDELASWPTVFREDIFIDRVIVVTGGAGVIGTALCVFFGRLGATVVACGRSRDRLDELSRHLTRLAIRHSTPSASPATSASRTEHAGKRIAGPRSSRRLLQTSRHKGAPRIRGRSPRRDRNRRVSRW